MGRTCTDETPEETILICHHEEDETLSLSDLPVDATETDRGFDPRNGECFGNEEPFSFEFRLNPGSTSLQVGSCSSEPAGMSTADELFFKGQMLPLRQSLSSDTGWNPLTRRPTSLDLTPFHPRSGSADIRRPGSGSMGSSRGSTSGSEPGIKNNFLNNRYPSPQPHVKRTSRLKTRVSVSGRNPRNTIWEFFRPGLVRAPEMELQDIKNRNPQTFNQNRVSVSRNSSSSSTNTSYSSAKNSSRPLVENPNSNEHKSKQRSQNFGFVASDWKFRFLFGDCRCSVDTIETIPLNYNSVGIDDFEEKLRDLRKKKKKKMMMKEKEKQEQKQNLSRNRTCEWLKEVSQTNLVDP